MGVGQLECFERRLPPPMGKFWSAEGGISAPAPHGGLFGYLECWGGVLSPLRSILECWGGITNPPPPAGIWCAWGGEAESAPSHYNWEGYICPPPPLRIWFS